MKVRAARPDDAQAIAAIYAPIVESTSISFELEPPAVDEMRARIVSTLQRLPCLVAVDVDGTVEGYVHASRHRERAACHKLGAWRDVGWWQKALRAPGEFPVAPIAFSPRA